MSHHAKIGIFEQRIFESLLPFFQNIGSSYHQNIFLVKTQIPSEHKLNLFVHNHRTDDDDHRGAELNNNQKVPNPAGSSTFIEGALQYIYWLKRRQYERGIRASQNPDHNGEE